MPSSVSYHPKAMLCEEPSTPPNQTAVRLLTISPIEAERLLGTGAVPIDLRPTEIFRQEHIRGALNLPPERMDQLTGLPARSLIFYCEDGACTYAAAFAIGKTVQDRSTYLLSGGLAAWRAAGMATTARRLSSRDIRHVQRLAAGVVVLAGLALEHVWSVAGTATAAGAAGWLMLSALCGLVRSERPRPAPPLAA